LREIKIETEMERTDVVNSDGQKRSGKEEEKMVVDIILEV